jgi:hypothetical protein
MLRSHHLCLYGNKKRKNYEVRSYKVTGKVCAGGVDTNYSIGSSPKSDVSPCLAAAVIVDRWCHCNVCGKRERRCVWRLVHVWSVSRMGWYMVVLTCVWNGVLSGVLAACVVVCAVLAVVSRSVFCPVGVPCVGLLVRRYAPSCKIS